MFDANDILLELSYVCHIRHAIWLQKLIQRYKNDNKTDNLALCGTVLFVFL